MKRWFVVLALFIVASGVTLGWYLLGEKQFPPLIAVPRFAKEDPFVVVCVENPDKILGHLRRMQGVVAFAKIADVPWQLLEAMEKGAFFAGFSPGGTLLKGEARTYGFSIVPKGDFLNQMKAGAFSGRWSGLHVETPDAGSLEGMISERDERDVRKLFLQTGVELYCLLCERGREDPLLLMSPVPDTLRSMMEALRNKERRLAVERKNSGPDFALLRFPVVSGTNAMAQSELAWLEDDWAGHLQIYSDYSRVAGKEGLSLKSGVKGDDLPLLGEGDLSFIAAADVPFLASLLFPRTPNPVDLLLNRFEEKLAPLAPFAGGDRGRALKSALEEGRISLVYTNNHAKGAWMRWGGFVYGVLESNDEAALDSLYAALSPGMSPLVVDDWTQAATRKNFMTMDFVLARRKKILLFGLGTPDDLKQKTVIPEPLKELPAPKGFIDVIVSAKVFDVFTPNGFAFLPWWLEKLWAESTQWVEKIQERKKLSFIHLRVVTPEKADLGIYFKR